MITVVCKQCATYTRNMSLVVHHWYWWYLGFSALWACIVCCMIFNLKLTVLATAILSQKMTALMKMMRYIKKTFTCLISFLTASTNVAHRDVSVSYTKKVRSLYKRPAGTLVVTAFKNGTREKSARVTAPNLRLVMHSHCSGVQAHCFSSARQQLDWNSVRSKCSWRIVKMFCRCQDIAPQSWFKCQSNGYILLGLLFCTLWE